MYRLSAAFSNISRSFTLMGIDSLRRGFCKKFWFTKSFPYESQKTSILHYSTCGKICGFSLVIASSSAYLFVSSAQIRVIISDIIRLPFTHATCNGIVSSETQTTHNLLEEENCGLFQHLLSVATLCLRSIQLFLTFGPLIIIYPLSFINKRIYALWLKLFLLATEFNGPAFIKLGQWASTRRDLFSKEFCDVFSHLHHHAQPHAWWYTEQILSSAYGQYWHKVLKIDKDQEPVGSGCVAQVYKAYISNKDLSELTGDSKSVNNVYILDGVEIQSLGEHHTTDGENKQNDKDQDLIPVAVKILHPKIQERFACDLSLMKFMALILETIIPSLRWINLKECVQEFSVSMMKQMDMVHEAKCLLHFHKDFSEMHSIRIPLPIMPLVRRNVLVESFEFGQPITDFLKDSEDIPKGLKEKVADIGVDALLQMVFVKNFVHGDLHPGNILVQNAKDYNKEPENRLVMMDLSDMTVTVLKPAECAVRLVFLDCGITVTLNEDDRAKFIQVFTAVVKEEGEEVANLFLEKSQHVECKDPDAFRKEMAEIVNRACKTTLQLSKIKVSVLLSEVFNTLARHHVKLESNFANIILAIAILEGLGRSLDPNVDILRKAKGVLLQEMIKEMRHT